MTKPDTGGRGEGRSSDLVMVEREVLERAHGHLCKIAGTEAWTHNNLDGWQVTPGALREYAESAAKELDRALQSVEGGVQGSIATKQATNETAASVLSGSPLADAVRAARGGPPPPRMAGSYEVPLTKSSGGHGDGNCGCTERCKDRENCQYDVRPQPEREARPSIPSDGFNCIYLYEDGREVGCLNGPQDDPAVIARANYWAGSLTKTPSADHDAGNLRGLAEPNHHQPHALSQATSPELLALIERAKSHVMTPEERYEQRRSFVRGMCPSSRDYSSWCAEVDKLLPPLPAPLSPENTPRDSSESTTGGSAPDHTTMEERGR